MLLHPSLAGPDRFEGVPVRGCLFRKFCVTSAEKLTHSLTFCQPLRTLHLSAPLAPWPLHVRQLCGWQPPSPLRGAGMLRVLSSPSTPGFLIGQPGPKKAAKHLQETQWIARDAAFRAICPIAAVVRLSQDVTF